MSDQSELVSVITPNYNGGKYIADTIRSVIGQTYQNWELIVIDDCSTDDSIVIIKSFIDHDPRIKLIELAENSGTVNARNKGIEFATGKYISFLDSDDIWLTQKLSVQLACMNDSDIAFTFTSYTMIDTNNNVISTLNVPKHVNYEKLLSKCDIGCSTVVYNTHIIGKQFFYHNSPKAREDYVLWLKIAKSFPHIKMVGIDESMMLYRKHDQGISANKSKAGMNVWKVYRRIEKLNFFKAAYYITQYAFYGIRKHYFNKITK